jgi:hypothetical protein
VVATLVVHHDAAELEVTVNAFRAPRAAEARYLALSVIAVCAICLRANDAANWSGAMLAACVLGGFTRQLTSATRFSFNVTVSAAPRGASRAHDPTTISSS